MSSPAVMLSAALDDVPAILALRDELARWMVGNSIMQWVPGEYPAGRLAAEVGSGEWYALWSESGDLRAAVRLVWSDAEFWGEDTPAGYIHGLMVAPAARGTGLGSAVLRFCGERTLAHGLTTQRLDVVASNPVLRDYYARHGFAEVREVPLPAHFGTRNRVVLLERALVPDGTRALSSE
ncbi:GNAT family N-acetyltransferase [Nocardia nova]|nr:GNAT family N-acetyltransferase [Nocardia nova]